MNVEVCVCVTLPTTIIITATTTTAVDTVHGHDDDDGDEDDTHRVGHIDPLVRLGDPPLAVDDHGHLGLQMYVYVCVI